MTKEEIKRHYEYFNEKFDKIYFTTKKKEKERIRDTVRAYVDMNDELYVLLSGGKGSGLFRHGFFNSDMSESKRVLKEALDNDE